MSNNQAVLPCPECNSKIPINLEILLSGNSIECNKCGIKIGLAGKDSNNQLRNLTQKLDEFKNK